MDKDLEALRAEIAGIDADIAELIGRRMKAAEHVASVKKREGLPIVNPEAEERVVQRYRDAAERLGISPEAMESVARILIAEAVRREEEVTR